MPHPDPWSSTGKIEDLPAGHWLRKYYEDATKNVASYPKPPTFRGDVPLYAAPDRAEWIARNPGRAAPFPLENVPEKYAGRARAALRLDADTITTDKVLTARGKLDVLCETVKEHAANETGTTIKESDTVFFDPTDGKFWVYPAA